MPAAAIAPASDVRSEAIERTPATTHTHPRRAVAARRSRRRRYASIASVSLPVALPFLADSPLAARAADRAANVHDGQDRMVDGAPFIVHPLEVAVLLHIAGFPDEVLAVALLHDVVEKSGESLAALRGDFGDAIADMVAALSEDPDIADYHERKADLRRRSAEGADDVVAVFTADKVVKARELRLIATAGRLPASEIVARRAHYVASLAVAERRLPGHPLCDALRFELDLLRLVPALARLDQAVA
jgi:HD domain-containing protein